MKKIVIIYDDSVKASERVRTILGKKSFGDMILKRQSMFTRTKKIAKSVKNTEIIRIRDLNSFDFNSLPSNAVIVHILSSSAVISQEDFQLLLEKATYAKDNFTIGNFNKIHGGLFRNRTDYISFIDEYRHQNNINFLHSEHIETNCFADLTDYNTLLMFISSGFDARFFNSLQGDAYTVTKKSSDKKKIKKEYSYYWLLPEAMKNWMVMPYNYQETTEWASYTMERMPMTDIAIRWTHGAIDNNELNNILDKTFYFLNHRTKKQVTKEEFQAIRQELYINKLDKRISDLKKTPEYKNLATLIKLGTNFDSIDEIISYYKQLYTKVLKNTKTEYVSVIGHGDVFFANMLYSKELNLLRFIDPKGALTEKELWMDPYYDVAKLSHSICGNYDFFNMGAYTINYNNNMKFELTIHYDNSRAKKTFQNYLDKNGYNYALVRLYESSLFLSMLPLHIDNPHKVFGFILNAINILKEINDNV